LRTIREEGNPTVKEVANDLAKLLAVIALTVVMAISMAALSLWAGSDAPAPAEQPALAGAFAASS
jgi:hypothetical protein